MKDEEVLEINRDRRRLWVDVCLNELRFPDLKEATAIETANEALTAFDKLFLPGK